MSCTTILVHSKGRINSEIKVVLLIPAVDTPKETTQGQYGLALENVVCSQDLVRKTTAYWMKAETTSVLRFSLHDRQLHDSKIQKVFHVRNY